MRSSWYPENQAQVAAATPARRLGTVAMMGAVLALAVPAQAQMRAATGSYVGNATGGRAIPVGFQPDVVIVKADSVLEAVATTSTMPADSTKFLSSGNAAANLIHRGCAARQPSSPTTPTSPAISKPTSTTLRRATCRVGP